MRSYSRPPPKHPTTRGEHERSSILAPTPHRADSSTNTVAKSSPHTEKANRGAPAKGTIRIASKPLQSAPSYKVGGTIQYRYRERDAGLLVSTCTPSSPLEEAKLPVATPLETTSTIDADRYLGNASSHFTSASVPLSRLHTIGILSIESRNGSSKTNALLLLANDITCGGSG